jgi:hypothetical protein
MLKTLHLLIGELERRSSCITAMKLASSLPDVGLTGKLINLANTPRDLDRVSRAIEALISNAGLSVTDANAALRNLLVERSFYGQYCELGAYEWLHRHNVAFDAQAGLTGHEVLNPNGCTIDGRLKRLDAYFDVKAMGFQAYVAEMFKHQLASRLPRFTVIIDGAMDVGVKDIERHAFTQLDALAKKLSGGGTENISQLGWTVRVAPQRDLTATVHTIDPYRLAQENRYYPFKTAGQFVRTAPFTLVFTYAAQFNHALFLNFSSSTNVTLRALARRAFFQLTNDATPATQFDNQVAKGISVADAAHLLSGLLFINLDNDEACYFLNPRATHPLTRSHIERMFDFAVPVGLGVDDFAFDNY